MNIFHKLPVGPNPPDELTMLVETPQGCVNKYEFDKNSGLIKLDRVTYEEMPYPIEYGLIPQTWYEDNDPLDVFCFTSYPTFPGCVLEVRTIGLMQMIDDGDVDDKVVAVPATDKRYDHVKALDDISPHQIKMIEFFFSTYKSLKKEGGVKTNVKGWLGKDKAFEVIKRAIELYKEKFSGK